MVDATLARKTALEEWPFRFTAGRMINGNGERCVVGFLRSIAHKVGAQHRFGICLRPRRCVAKAFDVPEKTITILMELNDYNYIRESSMSRSIRMKIEFKALLGKYPLATENSPRGIEDQVREVLDGIESETIAV